MLRIHTFTPEELADKSIHAAMTRPAGVLPGIPYLLTEAPTFMGLAMTTGIPLTELRDALATLPPPPGPTTTEEWNARALERYAAMRENQEVKGLRCAGCGGELVDTQPGVVLMSNPPKKRLDCRDCHDIEYIIV